MNDLRNDFRLGFIDIKTDIIDIGDIKSEL